jgi:hypothetical protein
MPGAKPDIKAYFEKIFKERLLRYLLLLGINSRN